MPEKIFGGEEEVVKEPKKFFESAMEYNTDEKKQALIEYFYHNRYAAHQYLFESRRKNKSPECHEDMLNLFYSDAQYTLVEAFRGAAKSTKSEEYAIIAALFKDSEFALIIGNSYDRACERLAAIKHEFETNDLIIELFGSQVGQTWAADVIVLSNGVRFQAFGAKQSLRGAKHRNSRPDLALVDDLEDDDMVATELARAKLARWFHGSLIPALTPTGKIRMVGTPLHPKCLLETLRAQPNWKSLVVPITYNKDGQDVSAWPDRFTMKYINDMKLNYQNAGAIIEFEQEYMCRAEDKATKLFQETMFKREPAPAGFSATTIMVDPARTVNTKTSARTGYAVWSWVGSKCYVREAYGAFHRPDEILKDIFRLCEKYGPVEVGVEQDGLEEFILQPLRDEQIRRGVSIPLSPQRAPKDKNSFIAGLQSFYMAGNIIHSGSCKDLEQELVAFPTGRCDVVNALAYAPRMRGGKPVYEDFGPHHLAQGLEVNRRIPRYLVVSASPSMVAAALVQFRDGNIYVLRDWVRNEPALEGLPVILQECILEAGEFSVLAPTEQFDKYTNNGIPAVLRTRKHKTIRGHLAVQSIGKLAKFLKTTNKGRPAFQVHPSAVWTVNGLAAGYKRRLMPDGGYMDYPEKNQYQLLLEAIESFASYIDSGKIEGDDELTRSYTSGGKAYYSALPPRK